MGERNRPEASGGKCECTLFCWWEDIKHMDIEISSRKYHHNKMLISEEIGRGVSVLSSMNWKLFQNKTAEEKNTKIIRWHDRDKCENNNFEFVK